MPAVPISKCRHNTNASRAASALTNKTVERASIQLVDPHFVFEEPEQLGLREFERISVGGTLSILRTGFAIYPDTERNARPYKNQRKKECRLNQARELEVCRFVR